MSRDMGCLLRVEHCSSEADKYSGGGVGDSARRENRHSSVNKVRLDPSIKGR